MMFDRARAAKALRTRTPPAPVRERADPLLARVVDELGRRLGATDSLGDPTWHLRWEGALQLVGLDASDRSVTDVRQRLVRTMHECRVRHLAGGRGRLLAVVLCAPRDGEGLQGWLARLDDERGEVGLAAWRTARRSTAVLAIDRDAGHRLWGGGRVLERAVQAWAAGEPV